MSTYNPLTPPLPAGSHQYIHWCNLYGDALALAIANTAKNYPGLTVVLTPDIITAYKLEEALQFFQPDLTTYHFPDWETLPYDNFSPHQDIISQRLATLYSLPSITTQGVLLAPVSTIMQRLPPISYISGHSLMLKQGDKLVLNDLRMRLDQSGYRAVSQVFEHGEFAVRGSLFDIFPMGSVQPLRIDLFGDEVDSIRLFDPDTQRSLDRINEIKLLPAREFPLTEAAISLFRQQWREKFNGNPVNCPIYQDISQSICSPGIEYYLPLFFAELQTLFDYLPNHSLLIHVGELPAAANNLWTEINERYEQRCHDITRPILAPTELFLRPNELLSLCNKFKQIKCDEPNGSVTPTQPAFNSLPVPDVLIDHKHEDPTWQLKTFINSRQQRLLICAETPGRREALYELLKTYQLVPQLCDTWQGFIDNTAALQLCTAPLEQGLVIVDPALSVLTENQLFGQQRVQQRRRKKAREYDAEAIIKNLAELQIGTPVVHVEHGVGRYQGLQLLTIGGIPGEYLTLTYANDAKLYVPVASLHLISRYSGAELEHAPIHRLGSEQWQKAKRKAAEQIHDVAAELLAIQAERAMRKGFMYEHPRAAYEAFANTFPFALTTDQETTISAIFSDMTQGKAMDRLVCGDVGFGKTEVAMRAAFIAVQNSKQVAVLVPTTLLAQQHYQNFLDRFAELPVRIEVLSRFRTTKEQTRIIDQLKNGQIDILIGTHKLLQSDVQFSRLGLIIIDEEHRFGVRQKERLKALRAEVDVLALTATPIPRTLNMSLSGVRDLSIIATPPARRLAIKTFVREYQPALIREAILREILRGGQVYYLYNAVETIEQAAHTIATLVPEARVSIAHGQMHERELEHVMADFSHHRCNVLVCSTIIENGIDIPAANTIIIERADKLGLAQLHQLRGRVGRSHHQAYAYLLTLPEKALSTDAKKRLEAISQLEELGAGFTLAIHDLEIRGAGELLGEGQSGHMHAIGFALYMELLERAVASLKNGETFTLDTEAPNHTEIKLPIPALLPESYVPDVHTRLILYKRMAHAKNQTELDEIQVELIDRFGLLPDSTKYLLKLTTFKIVAQDLGISKLDAGFKGGRVEFTAAPKINPARIIQLIQTQPQHYKLGGPQHLKFFWDKQTAPELLEGVNKLLNELKGLGF